MGELDAPSDDEDLWLARGHEVSPCRPLMQGDVFTLDDGEVCVIAHPCSMRTKGELHPEQTVARVESHKVSDWKGHFDWMPLPGLDLEGVADPAANLRVLRSVPTDDLVEAIRSGARIGVLSDTGIHLLQQRLACHLTRAVIAFAELAELSAPVLAEVELAEEWNEQLGPTGEAQLQALLDADARKLRGWLGEAHSRSQAMRAARQALRERGAETSTGAGGEVP